MSREYEGRAPAQIMLQRAHGETEGKASDLDGRYVEEEDDELWGKPQISSTTLKLAKFKKAVSSEEPFFDDLRVCGLGYFIANKGDPTTIDGDILDNYSSTVHRYKTTGRFEAEGDDPKALLGPQAPQQLRDQSLEFWRQIGQDAIDAGKVGHLEKEDEQPVPGVIEGPFDGENIHHPERISETNALIMSDMKIAAAHYHRWALMVNDATHFLSFATVQRDEWGAISQGAREHQKAFNKAYGAYVEAYGSMLKNGETPEQALKAVESMQDTAIKFHASASKSSKENTEEADEAMRQLLKRPRDEPSPEAAKASQEKREVKTEQK